MKINPDLCSACGQCADACPVECIEPSGHVYGYYIIGLNCVDCGACVEVCPQGAIGETNET